MATDGESSFYVGYNLAWRLIFLVFAICMLAGSIVLLVMVLFGSTDGLIIPSSMLVAAAFMALYLMPLISIKQQRLQLSDNGLRLIGYRSSVVLPWNSITGVRIKRIMLVMPYLTISLTSKEQLAKFLDENPRSFLAKWTAHVRVLRSYPFFLRWLFSVPKKMTTLATLDWLERRYGGQIVIDFAAVNGRGRHLEREIRANVGPRV